MSVWLMRPELVPSRFARDTEPDWMVETGRARWSPVERCAGLARQATLLLSERVASAMEARRSRSVAAW